MSDHISIRANTLPELKYLTYKLNQDFDVDFSQVEVVDMAIGNLIKSMGYDFIDLEGDER